MEADHQSSSKFDPRVSERKVLQIDPAYIDYCLINRIVGFERLPSQRNPTLRYYQINLPVFRQAITEVMTLRLTIMLLQEGILTRNEITTELNTIVPIIVDSCTSALYARLHNIHRKFGTHFERFQSPPSYQNKIELLPLPFADAIQNIGVFNPHGTVVNYSCIPVFPEGVQNEGRIQNFYSDYVSLLERLGIPVKSVDTGIEGGSSAWWTLKYEQVLDSVDFRCTYSHSNYSVYSAQLFALFMTWDEEGNVQQLFERPSDEILNTVCCREATRELRDRTFAALSHAPHMEWNDYLLIED